jgi:hypothetical protein
MLFLDKSAEWWMVFIRNISKLDGAVCFRRIYLGLAGHFDLTEFYSRCKREGLASNKVNWNSFMANFSFKSYWVMIVLIVLIAMGVRWWDLAAAGPIATMQDLSSSGAFVKYCAPFLIISLVIERAIEVVIGIIRDPDAEPKRQKQITNRFAYLKVHQKLMETSTAVAAYATLQAQVDAAQDDLDTSTKDLAAYQGETKSLAQQVGFGLGCLVAISGFRILQSLETAGSPVSGYFLFTDIIITAAVLSGGSDGIHRLINVYTSFVDGASKSLDDKANAKV